MASGILKLARRPSMLVNNEGLTRILGGSLHTTSKNNSDTWEIPERLHGIPTADHPSFFNMVEYYFHKACIVAEPSLMDMLHRLDIFFKLSVNDLFFSCPHFFHDI